MLDRGEAPLLLLFLLLLLSLYLGKSDSLCRDGGVMVVTVNRQVQPQALTFFTE